MNVNMVPISGELVGKFLKEAEIMKTVEPHENVVRYFGQCTLTYPPMLVLEFCDCGNLRDALRKVNDLLSLELRLNCV